MSTLPGDISIAQRIAQAALSPSHRQIAVYVLDHPLRVAAMRVEELAEITGVSVPTTNRFARALGFDGYAQFRTALVLGFEAALAPVEKLRDTAGQTASAADIFARALDSMVDNAARTRQSLDAGACRKAVSAILEARRIFIIGFGASSWLGGLLLRKLDVYCDDVHLVASIEGSSHGARTLRRLNADDLVVVIAFPRYLSDTIYLATRARDAGARILALTDGKRSPLASLADISLFASTDSPYFANCEASALALIEALSSAVAHCSGRSVDAAAKLAESVLPWLHGPHAGTMRPTGRKAASAAATTQQRRPRRGA